MKDYIEDQMLMKLFSGKNFGGKSVNFKVKLDILNLSERNSSFKELWVNNAARSGSLLTE